MNFFKKIETKVKEQEFLSNFETIATQRGLNILGAVTTQVDYITKSKSFQFSFGLNRRVYSVRIAYNDFQKSWWIKDLEGNGFFHVFHRESLGRNAEDIVSKLLEIAQLLDVGKMSISHSDTFSIIVRNQFGIATVGVGVRYCDNTYYLYKNSIIRLGIPESLLIESSNKIECFRSGSNYVTYEEYENLVHPIKVTNDRQLALKILLTIQEKQRFFDD